LWGVVGVEDLLLLARRGGSLEDFVRGESRDKDHMHLREEVAG
jgi:hypothetical protein